MKITKKSKKKNRVNYNNTIKNLEDSNILIKNKDKKEKEINLNNKNNNNEKEINKISNKENIILKEIKNEFLNINKKLDEIIYRFKLSNNSINIVENQDNFNVISNPSENIVIQKIIENFFISRKYKEENKIQKIESFKLIGNKTKKNYNNKNSGFNTFPMIKKNIFQIKRTEELKILQQSELEKDSKIKSYRKKALPIIRQPLKSQLVENLFIPSLNQKELQI